MNCIAHCTVLLLERKIGEKVAGGEEKAKGVEPFAIVLIRLEGDGGLERMGIKEIHILRICQSLSNRHHWRHLC